MISATDAFFMALLMLFPNGDARGTGYAVLKEDHYQVTYIDSVRYYVPGKPPTIEAHVTQVDAKTGDIAPFTYTSNPELYGVTLPEDYKSSASRIITMIKAYENAYDAIEKYKTVDHRGPLQIIMRKDYYEIIFESLPIPDVGTRGDNFAYVVHVGFNGDILKIIAPR